MKERVRFVDEWERGELTMAALCRKYGISRQTGYKWVGRYQERGSCVEALLDASRAPHTHPWTTPPEIVDVVIRARKLRPRWGPATLHGWLVERFPTRAMPAPSTIGRILRRHGLTHARHRRRRTPPSQEPLGHCTQPNAVWTVDFKGHFTTGDGERCYPLTIMDAHSRFLLRCEGLRVTAAAAVWPHFESAFEEYGLPDAIRSDNGPPFASRGAGGLTELSLRWIRLGIRHERIEPGQPQQNGRHERFHRTLKHEVVSPPRATFIAQQRAFDGFRQRYNEERPHQALGGKPPSQCYLASQRPYPGQVPPVEYPFDCDVVRVDKQGHVLWGRRRIYVSRALRYERVNFEPIDDRCWEVYYGPILLGLVDARSNSALRPPRTRWRSTTPRRLSTM